jgi:hypothetical protein
LIGASEIPQDSGIGMNTSGLNKSRSNDGINQRNDSKSGFPDENEDWDAGKHCEINL